MDQAAKNSRFMYSVNAECICCAACWKEAPHNFASHPIDAVAYVCLQPQSVEEEIQCDKAFAICPVNAIHREETPILS